MKKYVIMKILDTYLRDDIEYDFKYSDKEINIFKLQRHGLKE